MREAVRGGVVRGRVVARVRERVVVVELIIWMRVVTTIVLGVSVSKRSVVTRGSW